MEDKKALTGINMKTIKVERELKWKQLIDAQSLKAGCDI